MINFRIILRNKPCRLFSSYSFESDTAVRRITDGNNLSLGYISDKYNIVDAPNGGYLTAIAISAAKLYLPSHKDPLTITAHFQSKAIPNAEVELQVDVLNQAKATSTVSVSLIQEGKRRCQFLATFGTLNRIEGRNFCNERAPDLPPLEECLDASKILRKFGDKLRIAQVHEFRVPKNDPFALTTLAGKVGNVASQSGYLRFADGYPGSLDSMAFFLDSVTPPILNIYPTNWVPTVEYTVHFWNKPDALLANRNSKSGNWYQVKFVTNYMKNNFLYTDGEIWESDGSQLLAKSRQYARLL